MSPPTLQRAEILDGRRLWVLATILGVVAAAIRLFAVWVILPQPFDSENFRAALALSKIGTLANPYALPTGPTAHVAPVYPFLVSLALRVTGNSVDGLLWVRSLIAVLFGGFVAALPLASKQVGLGPGAGLVAAVCFVPCGAPIFLSIEASGQSETPLVMMMFFGAMVLTIASLQRGELSPARGIVLGVVWGLAALTSPIVLPVLALTLAFAFALLARPARQLARFSLALLLALTATLLPWTLRNYREIGAISLVRDNFGLELAVSNSDDASADMRDNMRTTMLRHPFLSFREAALVAREGEVAYNARRGLEAKYWISHHREHAALLARQRAALFFFPGPAREQHAAFYVSVLMLATIGVVLLARRSRFLCATMIGAMITIAIPYTLVQSSPRYSYPILWILVLLAGVTVSVAGDELLKAIRRAREVRPSLLSGGVHSSCISHVVSRA